MHSQWNGMFSVSLLSMPVRVGSAKASDNVPLHQYCKTDSSRIRLKRVSEADGHEVPYADVVKGYAAPDGQIVMLSDDDFTHAYGETSRAASVLMFTDPVNIPRLAAGKSYYVQPGEGGEKPYRLLSDALRRSGKVAVLKIAIGQRENLAALYPDTHGYLILELIEWHDSIRLPDFALPEPVITDTEARLMDQMVDNMTAEFLHAEHKDVSQEKLTALVQAKLERGDIAGTTPDGPPVTGAEHMTNLMADLRASVEATKRERAS